MVKDTFIRIAPFIIGIIAIVVFSLFTTNQWFLIILLLLFALTNALKNLYFVNKNIKNHIIWINKTIDRLLGIIIGCLWIVFFMMILFQQNYTWITFLIVLVTMTFVFYIETKLQIEDDTQRKNHRDYKVISKQREQQLKILMISMTIISIILMMVSLYLKWWVAFGIAIAILFVVAVALIIYEKYFTTKL